MSEAEQQPDRTGDQHGPWGQLATLEGVTPETFDPYVGKKFHVRNLSIESSRTHVNPRGDEVPGRRDEMVELTLVEVKRFPKLKEREGGFEHRPREPFALLFQGPADQNLMSAELPVYQDQLGAGRLFFSVVQPSLQGEDPANFYEVVFG